MAEGLWALHALCDGGTRGDFRELQPTLFTADERVAYEFVVNYYRQFGDLPSRAALEQNGHGVDVAPTGNFPYHLDRLRTRAVYNAGVDGNRLLTNALRSRDRGEIMQAVRSMAMTVGGLDASVNLQEMGDLGQRVLDMAMAARSNPMNVGVTLGWPPLDELTGGAQPGDLVVLMARPNVGKSYTLAHMALAAWQEGRTVLFVTMEMEDIQMARRIIGIRAGMNPDRLRRGTFSDRAMSLVGDSIEVFGDAQPFYMLPGSFRRTTGDVDSIVQEMRPDIVYVDASYLMKPAGGVGKGKARWETQAEVHEELKGIAGDRRVPVACTVQVSRSGVKKKKRAHGLEDVAGTDVIPQIASIVVDLREGDVGHERDQRRFDLLKVRDGPLGRFTTAFEFEPFSMRWLEEVDAAINAQEVATQEQRDQVLDSNRNLSEGME